MKESQEIIKREGEVSHPATIGETFPFLATTQPMKSNGLFFLFFVFYYIPPNFLPLHKSVLLSIFAGDLHAGSRGGSPQIAILFIINLFLLEK